MMKGKYRNSAGRIVAGTALLGLASLLPVAGCTGGESRKGDAAHSGHQHGTHGAETAQADAQVKYTCPMHPQIVQDEPGSCPICGMDLVKAEAGRGDKGVSEDLPAGHAEVHLSPYRQQLIGVRTAEVVKKPVFRTVRAPGRIAFDPELHTAQIEYQEALRQYQRVKDSPLDSVRQNVSRMVEAAKIRLKVLGLSDEQIGDIRAGQNLSESLLVYEKGDPVWIYADVFERDLPYIKKGQAAKITGTWLEGDTLPGTVQSIDQVIDPDTRTAKVRIRVEKAPTQLRAESYVDVQILAPQGEHLAVPLDAVMDTGEERFVFVEGKGGHFEPRKVKVLFRAGDVVAVAEGAQGLNPGENIVVSGNFLVDSESRLKGVLNSMGGASGAPGADDGSEPAPPASGGHQH